MANTMAFRTAIALFAVLTMIPPASAFDLWKSQDIAESTDLQLKGSSVHQSTPKILLHLPRHLQEAKHIIETFESLPSCPKIATAALMNSCSSPHKSAEGDTNHVSHASDALKAYGARLAICELMEAYEAKDLIPSDCQAFVPSIQSTKKRTMAGYVGKDGLSEPKVLYSEYDELTNDNLDRCVRGLAQEPQSWSSYSNSKQNAVVICQSVQGELQLEHSVKTYEKIIDSFGGIAEHHEQMAHALDTQILEVRTAARDLVLTLQDQWTRIYGDMSVDVSDITTGLEEQLQRILHDASELTQSNLQILRRGTTDLNNEITAISQQAGQTATQMQATGYYVEHNLLPYLGMVLHDLGLQQELVRSNNDALNVAHAGLFEVVSQVNQTNNDLATMHTFAYHLRDQLQRANQDVEKFNHNVGYLVKVISYGWNGILGKLFVFIASVAIITPFSFGFWERFIDFSFLGNCGAALSTGLVFGMTFAYFIDTTTVFQEQLTEDFADRFAACKPVVTGLLIGVLGTLSVMMLHRAVVSCFTNKPYDPASPPIEMGDGVEKKWFL